LAVLAPKLAMPKFVSGSTPPELDGASAITSADVRCALDFWVVLNVQPRVLLEIVRVNALRPLKFTDALM
jgi:hypothetical protein